MRCARRWMTDAMAGLWINNLKPTDLRGRRDEDSTKGDYVVDIVNKELKLLKKEGWEVGPKAYCNAISVVGRYGKAAAAQQLFDEMVASKVAPGRQAYNGLLFAYVNSRTDYSGDRFLSIFQEMQQACPDPPDAATVAAVLHGLVKRGKHREALKAAEVFQTQGAPFTQHSYNILISSCSDMYEAYKIADMMKAAGFAPDEVTYGSMLKVCARSLDTEASRDVMSEMRKRMTPTVREWTGYMTVFKEARQVDEVLNIWEDMKAAGITPNSISYGTVIKAQCNGLKETGLEKYKDKALLLFDEAYANNAVTSAGLITIMMELHGLTKNAEGARKALGIARASGLKLTGYCKKYYAQATGESIR
eukprot:TRINITY_DN17397_c0_g1_i1.p1 TRINITY_DN17397_c0_g1~~TRINITY_DN17397_c0_g1_i1.p1  ORF type:complete len:362 (+),score=57.61 TRINITY_DN17397_c0_g1_i1:98-1183(+)